MATNILMPALSPTMTEGTLARWLKKEGETIKAGDVIAEIETDKATMEVEAVDEGVLGKILVADGTEGVKVNEPIAVLVEAGRGGAGGGCAGAETGCGIGANRGADADAAAPPPAAPKQWRRRQRRRRRRAAPRATDTMRAASAFSFRRWRGAWHSRRASILPR